MFKLTRITLMFMTMSLCGGAVASGGISSQLPLVGTFIGKTTGFAGFPLPDESQIPFVVVSNADRIGLAISLDSSSSLVEAGPWSIVDIKPDRITVRYSLASVFDDPEGLFITSGECATECWSYGITHTTLFADGTFVSEGRGVFLTKDRTAVIDSPFYDKPNSYSLQSAGTFEKEKDFVNLYHHFGIPLPPIP